MHQNRAAMSPPTPPTDEITTREAMAILDVISPATISRLVGYGRLKPSRKLPGKNGAFLFWRADVERLAEQRRAS
jgi:hypothetical protein